MPLKATTKKRRRPRLHEPSPVRSPSRGRDPCGLWPCIGFFWTRRDAVGCRGPLLARLAQERRINWFGDPDVLHSFTYLPDFARALIVLGRRSDTWGRAWHVPSLEPLSIRALAERAAQIGGIARPRIRRTPRFVLRLVGLVLPAASELIEMEYAFDRDFILSQDNWDANFDLRATDLNAALAETIDAWRREARYDGG